MAVVITHVDDLHKAEDDKNVPADETIDFSLDGIDYSADLTYEHATELRSFLDRYVTAIKASGGSPVRKKPGSHHTAAAGHTPLKQSRKAQARLRAFADSRPDLGESSYTTPGGGYYYVKRLRDEYAAYVAAHGEFPLPEDQQ